MSFSKVIGSVGISASRKVCQEEIVIYQSPILFAVIFYLVIGLLAWPFAIVGFSIYFLICPFIEFFKVCKKEKSVSDSLLAVFTNFLLLIGVVVGMPAFFFVELISGRLLRDEKAEKAEKRRREMQACKDMFESKLGSALNCSEVIVNDDWKNDFLSAKDLILKATSAYGEDYPGEAKDWLRTAICKIENNGRFGFLLALLIEETIDSFNRFDRDDQKSELHRRMWECARAITVHIEKMEKSN